MAFVYYLVGFGSLFFLLLKNKRFASMFLGIKYGFNYNFIATLSSIADWINRSRNKIEDFPNRAGEIAVVTGGARGLGLDVVRNLLRCGMHVIIAARSVKSAEEVVEVLKKEDHPGTASVMEIDVGSMKSVEKFCKEFKAKYDKLNVLINNAGIIFGDHRITEDRFEAQLATNYIGHFYLTHLLMPNLIAAGSSKRVARVVNVASCAHYGIHMFFEDFNMEKSYHPVAGYARSKMAQVISHFFSKKTCFLRKRRCVDNFVTRFPTRHKNDLHSRILKK
jgi:hypothetical protein